MLPSSEMNKMSVCLGVKANLDEMSAQTGLTGLFLGLCSAKKDLLLSAFLFFFLSCSFPPHQISTPASFSISCI